MFSFNKHQTDAALNDMAKAEVSTRRRASKATFRRFDVLFVGGLVLAWLGFIAWRWM